MLDPAEVGLEVARSFSPLKASRQSTQWYKLFLWTFFFDSSKSKAGELWHILAGALMIMDPAAAAPEPCPLGGVANTEVDTEAAVILLSFRGRLLGEEVGEVTFFPCFNCLRFRADLGELVSMSSSSSSLSSSFWNMEATRLRISSSSSLKIKDFKIGLFEQKEFKYLFHKPGRRDIPDPIRIIQKVTVAGMPTSGYVE